MGSSPELRLPGRASAADHSHMHGLHQQALQRLAAGYGGPGEAQGLLSSPGQHRVRASLGSVRSTGSDGHEAAGEGPGHCLLVHTVGMSCHGGSSLLQCLHAAAVSPVICLPWLDHVSTLAAAYQLSAPHTGHHVQVLDDCQDKAQMTCTLPGARCSELLSLCAGNCRCFPGPAQGPPAVLPAAQAHSISPQ